jgi:hypothetical protein
MKTSKTAALFVAFLLLAPSLLIVRMAHAPTPGAPVYFSIQPVPVEPLTNINSSVNGLETPATPSPVGQYFYVEIHVIGATEANVPGGLSGVEVHFDFGAILAYAQVINFTNELGTPGGVLTGPPSSLISAIQAGFYDNSDHAVSVPPYTGATRYEVASASTQIQGWNDADGLVAVILFQITGQPSQPDFYATMNNIFSDLTDINADEVTFDVIQGSLHLDASAAEQFYGLVVNVVGSGSVTKNPSAATYPSGTIVTLTAVPAVNWTFQSWSGDVSGTQNPVNVTMNANKTVTATFVQISAANYTLTVNIVGSGSVTKNPSAATYPSGTIVTLTAVPAVNWTFQSWSGDISSTQNPVNITMTGNKVLTATFSSGVSAANIDLFTQKAPFDGKGPNQSSDAFQQQELVILYAFVTFGGVPVANKIVGFQIIGPPNPLQNIIITGSATTNSSGIALFSFRIPTAPINEEQIVFGKWYAIATVDVDEVKPIDTLTFQVGWIIAITNIATLNSHLVAQTNFLTQETIFFNLTVENIAFTPKNAAITIDAKDMKGNPIIHIELDDLSIPPGESYIQGSSQIPENAKVGQANASATAYTAPPTSGGTPWSPSVFTTFNIVTSAYYTLTVNIVGNGSVTQSPSAATYPSGTVVTLTAVPATKWTLQSWTGDMSGTQNPVNITMTGNKVVTATFSSQEQPAHADVAITTVSVSPFIARAGDVVQILVEAANLGDYSETFDVTVYYDTNVIQVVPITLAPHSSQMLTAKWNTTNVDLGVYTISAKATIVEGDINPRNNSFTDGNVTVISITTASSMIYWALLILLMILGILGATFLILLMVYHSRRRRRRPRTARHYAVIVHPHV